MKRIVYILFLSTLISFSQTEKDNYNVVAKEFMKNYNNSNFNAIFTMFDSNMQTALPQTKTTEFLKTLKEKRGNIKEMMFNELKRTAHVYKTTFKEGVRNILFSLDSNNKINGLYISAYIPKNLPKLKRNSTEMILPFNEEWTVFWGGTNVYENYHVAYNNQKYAYDLVITKNGSSFKNDRSKNENFYVFGKEIIAPSKATVVKVITGVSDNIPGILNPKDVTGNTVILETENKEFILFAHFKEKSIKVKEGQKVNQGDILGLCGNSGNSSEPHLHLSLQNVKDMEIATGAKLLFNKIKVNGKIKTNYLPVKNDKIQNLKL